MNYGPATGGVETVDKKNSSGGDVFGAFHCHEVVRGADIFVVLVQN